MSKHGKNFENASKKIEADKVYSPREALELVKEMKFAKFDETVEVHVRTSLDPRQADQQIRDVVVLPKGLGKTVSVLVFAQGEAAAAAREAGADFVAETDDDLARIQGGYTDFDVAVGTVDMMGKVGRLGRVLGPRNLMPNPKAALLYSPATSPRRSRLPRQDALSFASIKPLTFTFHWQDFLLSRRFTC
jgi:large subunit ribosomal protein L1